MTRSIARPLLSLMLLAAVACAIEGDDDELSDITGDDRAALGPAQPYRGDASLAAREAELRGDLQARRQVAWTRLASILQPVSIPGCANRPNCAQAGQVALWQTWYDRAESRAMATWLADQGVAADDAGVDRAFSANAARQIGADYLRGLQQGGTPGDFEGFLGMRSAYSPQLVRHAIENGAQIRRCSGQSEAGVPTNTLSATNAAPCLTAEFPFDAAVIKAQWEKIDAPTTPVRIYDTSSDGLTRRFDRARNPNQSWQVADGQARPTDDQIVTATDERGVRYRLTALHLATKELRRWMWITLWWSPTPDQDFGADRPAAITGRWRNYKMCTAVDYAEADARDPRTVFAAQPSLGAALATSAAAYDPAQVATGQRPPTWCSNPFLEFPPQAAKTNCIGCHQHAGTGRADPDILNPADLHGRRRVRDTFLFDYLFSLRELVRP